MSRLTPDLDALVRGQHGDPFRLLGPHIDPRSGALLVRVLHPVARAVELRLRHPVTRAVAMTRRHPDGLFEAEVPEVTSLDNGIDYRLAFEFDGGGSAELDDAYRFGTITTDYEPGHPLGEGPTEEAAIADLMEQLQDNEHDRERRQAEVAEDNAHQGDFARSYLARPWR